MSWLGMDVYFDSDLPDVYHYSQNDLVHDIIIISQSGTELIESDFLHTEDKSAGARCTN